MGSYAISPAELITLGILITFVGFFIVFFAVIYGIFKSSSKGEAKAEGGGVIIIGPIPIVFGSSQKVAKIVMILAIILLIVAILFYLMPYITLYR